MDVATPVWPTGNVLELRPELSAQLLTLVRRSAQRLPGRLDSLMTARVEQLRGRPVDDAHLDAHCRGWFDHPDVTPAEREVLDLTERFVIDVRSIDDHGFDGVKEHYSSDEIAAICFRLALLEGVSKLHSLFP